MATLHPNAQVLDDSALQLIDLELLRSAPAGLKLIHVREREGYARQGGSYARVREVSLVRHLEVTGFGTRGPGWVRCRTDHVGDVAHGREADYPVTAIANGPYRLDPAVLAA